jgi:hypothetical protein
MCRRTHPARFLCKNTFVKFGQPWTREIAPGVFRLGTTYVGCYAVEASGAYTFVGARGVAHFSRYASAALCSRASSW